MAAHRVRGKVGIVGTGMVGSSFAYSLMQSGMANEIVLIDQDGERAEGEAMDLNHGLPFVGTMRIRAGGYADLAGAEVVVLTAGANQRPGQTRLDLLESNVEVFRDIVPKVVEANPDGVIVVATNPVDILTQLTAEMAGLTWGRVLGSGTILDTARFRYLLGLYYDINPRSVNALVVAEHGDTAVAVWSRAAVAGIPLSQFVGPSGKGPDPAAFTDIFEQVKNAAYEIVRRKQSTYYAIGLGLQSIVRAILRDQKTVLTVSLPIRGAFGVEGIALSLPMVVGRLGAEYSLELPMDESEVEAFRRSGWTLQEQLTKIEPQ
ncbi:L-lactate dehydrogenase [soil metagenome]